MCVNVECVSACVSVYVCMSILIYLSLRVCHCVKCVSVTLSVCVSVCQCVCCQENNVLMTHLNFVKWLNLCSILWFVVD